MRGRAGGASRSAAAILAAVAAALLGACATTSTEVPSATPDFAFVDAPFAVAGRLSAQHGREAVAVHFTWRHEPPRDELVVTTPLGQGVAELTGDASVEHVEVRMADGRQAEASDWPALTERTLGFPLPVAGLAAWIRAEPTNGASYAVETDGTGRVSLLRQEGWEIVYDYADVSARMPARLRVTYPEFEIRVVIDRWQ